MNKPSRKYSIIGAAALALSLANPSTVEAKEKPVPPVPADVREQGGDAVVDWMLENGYATPEMLRQHAGDKARHAAEEGRAEAYNPFLAKLKSGFDALPDTAFKVGVKPEWQSVAAKLTPDVLAKANKLETPKIYGVNGEGQLLIGDGGTEVPSFTLRQNYAQARSAVQAAGLSLMTESEYRSFNNGTMEVRKITWLESGDAPSSALRAYWAGRVSVIVYAPRLSGDNLGSRRVLRVKI